MNTYRAHEIAAAIGTQPGELQAQLQRWFEQLNSFAATSQGDLPNLATLVRLIASSEFAASVVLRDWQWFVGNCDRGLPDAGQVDDVMADIVAGRDSTEKSKSLLRTARQRFAVQILWQVAGAADDEAFLPQTLTALSDVADALIRASVSIATAELEVRFGEPRDAAGKYIPLVTLAMGKLGGRELNFSSDVDLIFLYPCDGETSGPSQISASEYFTRLTRSVIALLDEVTEDGFVYRVDTRLRPFGESGPPVSSFTSFENYLLRHGRSWERYAYIKARPITPDSGHAAIGELQSQMIDPFVYRRYLDYGVFESLRDMKRLIAGEVRKRELAGNIKLGPGGIREIEFIAQSLQLVRGGADERLRCRELQVVMPRLANTRDIEGSDVTRLLSAYNFLRRTENAVQAIRDQQTHDIPEDPVDRSRLVVAMGFANWNEFERRCEAHRATVAAQFRNVAFRAAGDEPESDSDDAAAALWSAASGKAAWKEFLVLHDFMQADEVAEAVAFFAASPEIEKADASAERRLARFIPLLLNALKDCRDAGVACRRVLAIASQILRRSAYLALLIENPAMLRHLVVLCEQSAYLAGEIARYPILLDELFDPRLATEAISAEEMRQDLERRLARCAADDSEARIEGLAKFQRAAMFRIAVADFSGSLTIMKVSDRLTELAEIVIECALAIAWQDLVARHGVPTYRVGGERRDAGLGIIAYGKLGGIELSYRSDLDLVFLHDSCGDEQVTNGPNSLDNSMFFSRLARRLTHFLTTQTGSGALYEVDTRLRPSGRSGLLVVSLEGFERYQEENAWTWEHQALLRSRAVAGGSRVAGEFERIRSETLCKRVRTGSLLADVVAMRAKMRAQLDQSDAAQFDLKQGAGGIGDIEFLVQYLVLRNAAQHPALIHYSDNIRQLGMLGAVGCLDGAVSVQLQECYRQYRFRLHRMALNEVPPLVDGGEFAWQRRFVIEVWDEVMR